MEKSNFLVYILGIAIIGASTFLYFQRDTLIPQKEVASFTECVEAGYPVMESYPRKCRDAKGNSFTEDIGNILEKQDFIRVANITPNQIITSPITINGEARGMWYFEASFPVSIIDEDGKELVIAPAQAQGEWMTEDFVPFSITLTFDPGTAQKGTIILKKDNPSGLPEHDDSLSIPVQFQPVSVSQKGSGISGTVLLGPTCPVERIPPDPNCAYKPYQTKLALTTADGKRVIKEFVSGKDGTFNLPVLEGEYAIRNITGAKALPYCASTETIKVVKNIYTTVTVSCDSGIR